MFFNESALPFFDVRVWLFPYLGTIVYCLDTNVSRYVSVLLLHLGKTFRRCLEPFCLVVGCVDKQSSSVSFGAAKIRELGLVLLWLPSTAA